MTKAALTSLCLFVACAASLAQNQPTPAASAADEAVRREAYTIDLRRKLADAQAAQKKGDIFEAAKLYEEGLALTKKIGPTVEAEGKQVLAGMTTVRLELAQQAQRRGDLAEADRQVSRILKEDPKNEAALAFKKANDQMMMEQAGRRPSDEALAKLPEIHEDQIKNQTLVQDAKLLFEAGKLNEAATNLLRAIKQDPSNKAAFYYLDLVMEQRHRQEMNTRESFSKKWMLDVSDAWKGPIQRHELPTPNPYARTNLVYTGKGRQMIYSKLERIRLNEVSYDGLPLGEVIKNLSEEAKKRDPSRQGINILIAPNVDPPTAAPPQVDPATGLPVPAAAGVDEPIDLSTIIIKIVPSLTDVSLAEAFDAVVKVADRPIKYSVEDYAIVFSLKAPEPLSLHTRWFKIDPNTFAQGMQGVELFGFGQGSGQTGGGGGGFGGGGGRSGGGGGFGGGQGGQGGGGGGGSFYAGVTLGTISQQGFGGGGFGGGGGGFGATGAQGQQGQGGGIDSLTVVTRQQQITAIARDFFTAAGVDFGPLTAGQPGQPTPTPTPGAPGAGNGKTLFFNDRLGMLMVRATLQDLDIIEQAVQVLNMSPPQVTIEAKFAEVTQDDSKALGFDWILGNWILGGGVVGSGGTQPSFNAPGSQANPLGFFPGTSDGSGAFPATTTPPSGTDQIITSGLRNSGPMGNTIPAVASITGILTDPQFKVIIRALEQRTGVDLLSAPKVTTLSHRQAQIKAVDVRYIVTANDLSQTSSSGSGTTTAVGGTTTGGGTVGSVAQPIAEPYELGPVLDVLPSVSADGYTIQMTIIPTLKEFIGYDLETGQLFAGQAQSVGTVAANPLTTTTPLPIFRLRTVVTSAIVWDGQTVVLGGLISENVTKTKDKVPVLGDLPLLGRFFRTESMFSKKKNLLVFVTPTIIDPAGNRVHSEAEMPFAQNAIPPQKPVNP